MVAAVVAGPPKKTNWYTVGGGGIGAGALGLFGGPIVALVTGAIGATVGYFYGAKIATEAKTLLPPSAMQALGLGAAPAAATQTTAAQVASSGAGKAAAAALYAYLKANGPNGSNDLANLVSQFQQASNSDPQGIQLTGPLPITAAYDAKTSAALTIYTHDPIPPATAPAPQPPPTPAQVADIYLPGAAATSGYNLYMYLKAHSPHSPTDGSLNKLVHQFQIDVDTDPKFPGPAAVIGQGVLARVINTPLAQTGAYDAPTAAALTVLSNDPIAP